MPSKVLDFKTPLHTLSMYVTLPTMLMIPPRVFGCVAFVHLYKIQLTKLDPCAIRCCFLGYALHQKGYRCYDPANNHSYVIMDVTFLEMKPFFPSPVPNFARQGEIHSEEPNWLRLDWARVNEAEIQDDEEFNDKEVHKREPHIGLDMSAEIEPNPREVSTLPKVERDTPPRLSTRRPIS
jgi:hypothetical protein